MPDVHDKCDSLLRRPTAADHDSPPRVWIRCGLDSAEDVVDVLAEVRRVEHRAVEAGRLSCYWGKCSRHGGFAAGL